MDAGRHETPVNSGSDHPRGEVRRPGASCSNVASRAEPGIVAKRIELRRHTDNDGEVLTDEGAQAALEIG